MELCIRAADLGSPEACSSIASYYQEGTLIPRSLERATLLDRVGAVRGSIISRHGIGIFEYYDAGNHELGIRHWKIAAEAGDEKSLAALKHIYNVEGTDKKPGNEFITKEYFDFVCRACHEAQMEIKSEAREKHQFPGRVIWLDEETVAKLTGNAK